MAASTGCREVQAWDVGAHLFVLGTLGVRYEGEGSSWPWELSSVGCLTIVGIVSAAVARTFCKCLPGWAWRVASLRKTGRMPRCPYRRVVCWVPVHEGSQYLSLLQVACHRSPTPSLVWDGELVREPWGLCSCPGSQAASVLPRGISEEDCGCIFSLRNTLQVAFAG